MKVYIAFGDEPRSDWKNVLGVFATQEDAKKCADKYYPSCIKDFDVQFSRIIELTKEQAERWLL